MIEEALHITPARKWTDMATSMILPLVWCLLVFPIWYWAKRRNRNPLFWMFLALIVSPVVGATGLLIADLIRSRHLKKKDINMFISRKTYQAPGISEEMRSSGVTRSIAFGFKVIFEAIVVVLLIILGVSALAVLSDGSVFRYLSGLEILMMVLSVVVFLAGLCLLFGMIAIQIRNNDLLMDIRDGQRDLNGTMRELIEIAREEADDA